MIWFKIDDELGYVEPYTERMQLWDKYNDELYGHSESTAKELKMTAEASIEVPETFSCEAELPHDFQENSQDGRSALI